LGVSLAKQEGELAVDIIALPFGLGITLPFSPRSTPAFASAFTTARIVALCPLMARVKCL
jgi:hypothetical protein